MPENLKNHRDRIEEADDGRDVDIVEMIFCLLEKAHWIVLAAVLGALIFGLVTQFCIKKTYRSTAKLYVVSTSDSAIDLSAINMGDKVADDFVQVFKNRDAYDTMKDFMRVNYGVDVKHTFVEIQRMLTVTVPNSTRIIELTVSSPSKDEAYQLATAYAQVAQDFIEDRMQLDPPTIFENARRPEKHSEPVLLRNVIIGFVLGAALAIAVILILFIADDRVRSAEQLQKMLMLPTLGMMPIQESERRNVRRNDGRRARK